MSLDYGAIAILFLVAVGVAGAMLVFSTVFGPRQPNPEKLSPYECGIDPRTDARLRFPIKFFLIAIIFILFDIEVIFLYPWAVLYKDLGILGLLEMVVFLIILLFGYIYLYKKGAFEWE